MLYSFLSERCMFVVDLYTEIKVLVQNSTASLAFLI